MLSTISAVVFGLNAVTTLARPAPQLAPISYCEQQGVVAWGYENNDGGHIVDGTPFVGGVACDGSSGTCAMTLTETYTVSTTITVGTSFSLDIGGKPCRSMACDIIVLTLKPEIFGAGVDFSVAETKGTGIGEGATDTCPTGNWTCRLSVTPYLVEIGGKGTPYDCHGAAAGDPEDYVIQSPNLSQSGSECHISREYCSND